jgi:hypothetical protein
MSALQSFWLTGSFTNARKSTALPGSVQPEYKQDPEAYSFTALLPYLINEDYTGHHRQSLAFDGHLRKFLSERVIGFNVFATSDELRRYLGEWD